MKLSTRGVLVEHSYHLGATPFCLLLQEEHLLELLSSLGSRDHVLTGVHEVASAPLELLGNIEVLVEMESRSDLIIHLPVIELVKRIRENDVAISVKFFLLTIAVIDITI